MPWPFAVTGAATVSSGASVASLGNRDIEVRLRLRMPGPDPTAALPGGSRSGPSEQDIIGLIIRDDDHLPFVHQYRLNEPHFVFRMP